MGARVQVRFAQPASYAAPHPTPATALGLAGRILNRCRAMVTTLAPEACPNCGALLPGSPVLRPRPAWQLGAKLLFGLGAVVSGVLIWEAPRLTGGVVARATEGLGMYLQDRGWLVFFGFLSGVPVALVQALLCGWLARRMPRVLRLSCRKCGWHERFSVGHRRGLAEGPEKRSQA
jgi:hypothetical protein